MSEYIVAWKIEFIQETGISPVPDILIEHTLLKQVMLNHGISVPTSESVKSVYRASAATPLMAAGEQVAYIEDGIVTWCSDIPLSKYPDGQLYFKPHIEEQQCTSAATS